jgi:flagellar hook-basal body complex protein FliE
VALKDINGGGLIGPQRLGGLDRGGLRLEGRGPTKGASFQDALKAALGDVSQLQSEAQSAIGSFVRGEPVELHQVMAAAEEAGIALELLIEIRNKLTEAYRAVINMQN